jgi:hypothetical protein
MLCMKMRLDSVLALVAVLSVPACTQEQRNRFGRGVQNWTGSDGVLEIYAGDKVVRRFLKVEKLSTALGTDDGRPRDYRYGFGVMDENLNMLPDPTEKRVYFEISNHTNMVFFENPR